MSNIKKFEDFVNEKLIIEGNHSEKSEKIWFKSLDLIGFEELKNAAKECYPNTNFSWCDTESDLWNELDFKGYFDEFCETFLVNRLPELENLTEGKVSDVEHIGHGLKYHNEYFNSYNQPKKYEGKGKHKWRVLAKEGDKVKFINFGKRDDIKKEDLTKLSKKYWEHFWK